MSLIVHPYVYRDGLLKYIPTVDASDLFGFESCRRDLWGHPVMTQLGLVLLPSLRETDIFAEGEKLRALEKEIRTINSALLQITEATSYPGDFIAFRCQNALRAVEVARELGGGVYIG